MCVTTSFIQKEIDILNDKIKNINSLDNTAITIAIGKDAGKTSQGDNAVAVGSSAGNSSQGIAAVAIGATAGNSNQGYGAVAVGSDAGVDNQGDNAVAVGYGAGNNNQGSEAIAVGTAAGLISQGSNAVAVGATAGNSNQGSGAVAIGYNAGNDAQSGNAIAVGFGAGNSNQGSYAVAIGAGAGYNDQSGNAVAVGTAAGYSNQGSNAVAVGNTAGLNSQGSNAVAVGGAAGYSNQGSYSIAIGYNAGVLNQPSNSIIFNAKSTALNTSTSGFFVAPINTTNSTNNGMCYDIITHEITYNTNKSFVIPHPTNNNKYLVHACLEGPEAGVYYRGKGTITNNTNVTIKLPDYLQYIGSNYSINITRIFSGVKTNEQYEISEIENNEFTVYGTNGSFYWVVFAERSKINVEPNINEVTLHGDGPYKYLVNLKI